MNDYIFSASSNAFYPLALKAEYIQSGTWPDDAMDITESKAAEFMGVPPEGKYRVVDNKGMPKWAAVPPLTQNEQVAIVEAKRASLISEASNATSIWQTQLLLGIISDADKESLTKWMHYIQAVQAVDASSAPDISWPVKPV